MRIPIGQGIAGHVATSGTVLNIKNAYEHPLFYPGIDQLTGFKTRNILCFPIRDEEKIIGKNYCCISQKKIKFFNNIIFTFLKYKKIVYYNVIVIIGVAQLCNKKNGLYFDVFDEEVATAFSIYCGISLMHSIVYKKMQIAQARSKLSNEVMMYHMKVKFS